MIIKDRSFPHPVLAPFRDDVQPNNFEFEVTVTSDADNYYVAARFAYDNATMQSLIATGRAIHAVHFECRRNFFREIFEFSEKAKSLTISTSQLVGRVEVSGFIKALGRIEQYRVEGAHPDYGERAFGIRNGDVLAVAPSQYFDAYVDYDPLRNIASILTIQRSPEIDEGEMTLDTSGNRIVANLAQRDYERYTDLKADPKLGSLLANQVVVPAILEAIHEIRDTPEDDFEIEMSKRWFRSIVKKFADSGINIRSDDQSPVEAAQKILQLPLRRSLESLIQMNPLEEGL
jgi:hypothetical protein